MKLLVNFILVYLFITNALSLGNFKMKMNSIFEDFQNIDKSINRLSKKEIETLALSENVKINFIQYSSYDITNLIFKIK